MDQPMGVVDRYAPIFGAPVKPGFADSPGASNQPLPAVRRVPGPKIRSGEDEADEHVHHDLTRPEFGWPANRAVDMDRCHPGRPRHRDRHPCGEHDRRTSIHAADRDAGDQFEGDAARHDGP